MEATICFKLYERVEENGGEIFDESPLFDCGLKFNGFVPWY